MVYIEQERATPEAVARSTLRLDQRGVWASPWPASGSLALSRPGYVLNLIEDVELDGEQIMLDLGPSEIKTFRVDLASGARPAGARVALCEEGVEELKAMRHRAGAALTRLKAGEVSLNADTTTVEKIESTLAEVDAAFQAQVYAYAYRSLCSRPIVYLLAAK